MKTRKTILPLNKTQTPLICVAIVAYCIYISESCVFCINAICLFLSPNETFSIFFILFFVYKLRKKLTKVMPNFYLKKSPRILIIILIFI